VRLYGERKREREKMKYKNVQIYESGGVSAYVCVFYYFIVSVCVCVFASERGIIEKLRKENHGKM
jgi:hypothetical protein